MTKLIKVRFQLPGFHCWPQAPAHRAYLRENHRHMFHFQVECGVEHEDRHVEFHDLREYCVKLLYDVFGEGSRDYLQFDYRSCESIAVWLAEQLMHLDCLAVEVWEDNECGARVETKLAPDSAHEYRAPENEYQPVEPVVEYIPAPSPYDLCPDCNHPEAVHSSPSGCLVRVAKEASQAQQDDLSKESWRFCKCHRPSSVDLDLNLLSALSIDGYPYRKRKTVENVISTIDDVPF